MSTAKFEYIWKFLRDYRCSEADNISEDMICVICKGILVDPCIGCCGCRYCLACVTEYLNETEKYCPGITDECRDELMELDNLGHPDYAMNRRISNLIMKCPQDLCEYKGELKKMEEHERVCKKQVVNCPYYSIGCRLKRLLNDRIGGHLLDENESHARLLMDCVGGIKNEIELVNNDHGSLTTTLSEIREEADKRQMIVERHGREIDNLNEQMRLMKIENNSIKEENSSLKLEIEGIRAEYVSLSADAKCQISEILARAEVQAQEIQKLKEKCSQSATRLEQMQPQVANEKGLTTAPDLAMSTEMGPCQEFVWAFSGWTGMMELSQYPIPRRTFSKTFSSLDGKYQMCLSVWHDSFGGSNYLSVWWYLVQGPFDENLCWPFKGVVILSLINQETWRPYTSESISSEEYPDHPCWKRPTSLRNRGFASYNMINLDTMAFDPALCSNDQILIKCVVKATA